MDLCKITYFSAIAAFLAFYAYKDTWLMPDDFTWPRFVFLFAALLMLEKYDLVPRSMRCPPFYMVYKIIAAIVIADSALFTVWYQVEDLLIWVLNGGAKVVEKTLDTVSVQFDYKDFKREDQTVLVIQMLSTIYLFLWVLVSSGYIPPMKGRNQGSKMNLRSSSLGRRRRSKVRC